jgi:hypothetical protein
MAARAELAGDVRAVELFGAYFDARSFARSVASETVMIDGVAYSWPPDRLTRATFRRLVVENLPDPADRAALAPLIDDVGAEPAGSLGHAGQTARELLRRPSYERAGALLEALPTESKAYLQSISPSTVIDKVRAPLFVLHDQGDQLIPFGESRSLVAAVPAERVVFTELAIFDHVTPRSTAGPVSLAIDGIRLFANVHGFLARVAG